MVVDLGALGMLLVILGALFLQKSRRPSAIVNIDTSISMEMMNTCVYLIKKEPNAIT